MQYLYLYDTAVVMSSCHVKGPYITNMLLNPLSSSQLSGCYELL